MSGKHESQSHWSGQPNEFPDLFFNRIGKQQATLVVEGN